MYWYWNKEKRDLTNFLNCSLAYKVGTVIEAIVPWADKKIMAGIDSERAINLPVKGQLEYNRMQDVEYVQLTFKPTISKKVIFISKIIY